MTDTIDLYSDSFQLTLTAYGASLVFNRNPPTPPSPGTMPQVERQATIRMSHEHLKIMVFILHRNFLAMERQTGVSVGLPHEVLNSLSIGREDWDKFWSGQ